MYRTIVFLPYMIAIPVLGTTFVYLLSLNGAVNETLRSVGLGFLAQDWLGARPGCSARSRSSSSTTSWASEWCCSWPAC